MEGSTALQERFKYNYFIFLPSIKIGAGIVLLIYYITIALIAGHLLPHDQYNIIRALADHDRVLRRGPMELRSIIVDSIYICVIFYMYAHVHMHVLVLAGLFCRSLLNNVVSADRYPPAIKTSIAETSPLQHVGRKVVCGPETTNNEFQKPLRLSVIGIIRFTYHISKALL